METKRKETKPLNVKALGRKGLSFLLSFVMVLSLMSGIIFSDEKKAKAAIREITLGDLNVGDVFYLRENGDNPLVVMTKDDDKVTVQTQAGDEAVSNEFVTSAIATYYDGLSDTIKNATIDHEYSYRQDGVLGESKTYTNYSERESNGGGGTFVYCPGFEAGCYNYTGNNDVEKSKYYYACKAVAVNVNLCGFNKNLGTETKTVNNDAYPVQDGTAKTYLAKNTEINNIFDKSWAYQELDRSYNVLVNSEDRSYRVGGTMYRLAKDSIDYGSPLAGSIYSVNTEVYDEAFTFEHKNKSEAGGTKNYSTGKYEDKTGASKYWVDAGTQWEHFDTTAFAQDWQKAWGYPSAANNWDTQTKWGIFENNKKGDILLKWNPNGGFGGGGEWEIWQDSDSPFKYETHTFYNIQQRNIKAGGCMNPTITTTGDTTGDAKAVFNMDLDPELVLHSMGTHEGNEKFTVDGTPVTLVKNDTTASPAVCDEMAAGTPDGTFTLVADNTTNDNLDTIPTPTRAGYTFDGWFTEAEGGTNVFGRRDTLAGSNMPSTIYAHWTPKTIRMTFSPNSRIGVKSAVTTTITCDAPAEIADPTKIGYDFEGWATANDATMPDYTTNNDVLQAVYDLIKADNDTATFYAVWAPKNTDVTFVYCNGDAHGTSTSTIDYNDSVSDINLNLVNPEYEGYELIGWAEQEVTPTYKTIARDGDGYGVVGQAKAIDNSYVNVLNDEGVKAFVKNNIENDITSATLYAVWNKQLIYRVGDASSKVYEVRFPCEVIKNGRFSSMESTAESPISVTFKSPTTYIEAKAFDKNNQKVQFTCFAGSTADKYGSTDLNKKNWCQVTRLTNVPYGFLDGEEVEELLLPSEVTVVQPDALNGHTELQSISIAGVKTIGARAFKDTSITSLVIPEGCTTIGESAFENCSNLTGTLVIPKSVTTIGANAFKGTSLTKIIYLNASIDPETGDATIPTGIDDEAFPSEATADFCLRYGFNASETELSPEVLAKHPELANAPFIQIGPNVTKIADNTFKGKTGLECIDLSNATELKEIGDSAFENTGIESIDFTTTKLEKIGNRAFAGTNLTNVSLPNTCKEIGKECFANCNVLKTVKLGGVTEVPDRAFSGCSSLTNVIGSENLEEIGEEAFAGIGTTTFNTGIKLRKIGKDAFKDSKLNTLIIKNPNLSIKDAIDKGKVNIIADAGSVAEKECNDNTGLAKTFENGTGIVLKTITLDNGEGATGNTKHYVIYNEVVPSVVVPTKPRNEFKGYSRSASNRNSLYFDANGKPLVSKYNEQNDLTLYAIWDTLYLNIKFDANGGSGSMSDLTNVECTEIIDIPQGTGFSRGGYDFVGWGMTPDATAAQKLVSLDGNSITKKNITLYAIWTPKNDTKTPASGNDKPAGGGGGGGGEGGGSSKEPAEKPVAPFTITYDTNGSKDTIPTAMTDDAGKITLSDKIPTLDGKTFLGWAISKTSKTAAYKAGQTATFNNNATLYAVWQGADDVTYKVVIMTQVMETGTASPTITYETVGDKIYKVETKTAMGNAASGAATLIAGKDFILDTDYELNTSASVLSGQVSNSLVLKAVLDRKQFTLTYDLNGAEGLTAPAPVTAYWGKVITLDASKFNRVGFKFLGWAADKTSQKPITTVTMGKANMSVYAIWGPSGAIEVPNGTSYKFVNDYKAVVITYPDKKFDTVNLEEMGIIIGDSSVTFEYDSVVHAGTRYVITVSKDSNRGVEQNSATYSGVTYVVKGKNAVVSSISKSVKTANIKDKVTIKGKVYKVTAINAKAAKGRTKLTKVTISGKIKSIGANAFAGAKNLKTIIIKSKKIKIGKSAFKGISKKATFKLSGSKKQKAKIQSAIEKAGYVKTMTIK